MLFFLGSNINHGVVELNQRLLHLHTSTRTSAPLSLLLHPLWLILFHVRFRIARRADVLVGIKVVQGWKVPTNGDPQKHLNLLLPVPIMNEVEVSALDRQESRVYARFALHMPLRRENLLQ